MSRKLPEVTEHMTWLTPGMINVVNDIKSFVASQKPKRVHIYAEHYDRIRESLGGAGFDVARGFRIAGVKTIRYQG